MSIKTNFEIPRAVDENDIVKQGQRTAQDLSKNFKAIKKQLDNMSQNQSTYGLDGIIVSQSFSVSAASYSSGVNSYVLNHNFNAVPSGYIILDFSSNYVTAVTQPVITRSSWTSTQITFNISILNIDMGGAHAISGSFKVLILR